MGRYRKKKNKTGRMSIACILMVLLLFMSVQIIKLYQKDQEYIAREADLTTQFEQETERADQLSDYEKYIGSQEYVEDTAKSKLGMVYDHEIIFKEK
jgi:cell division protein DivIC